MTKKDYRNKIAMLLVRIAPNFDRIPPQELDTINAELVTHKITRKSIYCTAEGFACFARKTDVLPALHVFCYTKLTNKQEENNDCNYTNTKTDCAI